MSIAQAKKHIQKARAANRMFVSIRRDCRGKTTLAHKFLQARDIQMNLARGCIRRAGEQA